MIAARQSTSVLHVTPCLEPAWAYGRVAHDVLELARAQVLAGDSVRVLTTDALAPHERLPSGESIVDGVRVVRVRNLSGAARTWLDLSTPLGMRRHLRTLLADHAIDVVHLHEPRTVENVIVAGALADDVPIVLSPYGGLTTHAGASRLAPLWDATVGDRVLSRVRQFVARTEPEADQIRALCASRGFDPRGDQVTVVANGVDLSALAADVDAPAARRRFGLGDGPVVLSLGRLSDRSGVLLLIEAFAAMVRDHPRAQMLIVGSDHGALLRARSLVADFGLESATRFAGHLTGAEITAAFAAADLLALPTLEQGPPLEALRALASGVPALVSPSCNLPQDAHNGAGLVVEQRAAAWTAAMKSVLAADEGSRSAMRERAKEAALRFTWPATATALQRVYERARAVASQS